MKKIFLSILVLGIMITLDQAYSQDHRPDSVEEHHAPEDPGHRPGGMLNEEPNPRAVERENRLKERKKEFERRKDRAKNRDRQMEFEKDKVKEPADRNDQSRSIGTEGHPGRHLGWYKDDKQKPNFGEIERSESKTELSRKSQEVSDGTDSLRRQQDDAMARIDSLKARVRRQVEGKTISADEYQVQEEMIRRAEERVQQSREFLNKMEEEVQLIYNAVGGLFEEGE